MNESFAMPDFSWTTLTCFLAGFLLSVSTPLSVLFSVSASTASSKKLPSSSSEQWASKPLTVHVTNSSSQSLESSELTFFNCKFFFYFTFPRFRKRFFL